MPPDDHTSNMTEDANESEVFLDQPEIEERKVVSNTTGIFAQMINQINKKYLDESDFFENELSHLTLLPMLKRLGTEWTKYEWSEWKFDIKFIGKQVFNTILLGLRLN